MAEPQVLNGTPYVNGSATATVLAANLELSFWGGVDARTGEVIDRFHPLSGKFLKDTILAIPGSRGSCGGSAIMMELILNGLGPKALIFERREEIISLGVIVAEEFFDQSAPVVTLKPEDFKKLLTWDGKIAHVRGGQISHGPLGSGIMPLSLPDVKDMGVQLSKSDLEILDGQHGESARLSLRIIIRVTHMMGARELMDVTQAHADAAWYGPGSVEFGKRLRDRGGRFRVPTTINSLNIDQKRWRSLGVDAEYGSACDELAQAFVDMGGTISFTCAPYLLDTAPKKGDAIAWGESNAVIYANSVLGARTLKNPNMLECLIALTGRAPKAGAYLDENRIAAVWVKVAPIKGMDDSFWPILGYTSGAMANARVPVITGLEHCKPTTDDFKAFAAAFATASSAPMFHIVNLTPEAPTLESVSPGGIPPESLELGLKELEACWDEFNHGSSERVVDLVSFGNPHFSFQEINKVAFLARGKVKKPDVSVMVTVGRSQYGLAEQAGFVAELEKFGVRFLTDTCWCSIEEPIIPKGTNVIMTNSGDDSAWVPTTVVYTVTDDIVQPQSGRNASAFLQDTRNVGAANVELQSACPLPSAELIGTHKSVLYSAPLYDLIKDALTHEGSTSVDRTSDFDVACSKLTSDNLYLEDVIATTVPAPAAVLAVFLYHAKVVQEPAISSYAQGISS